MSGTELIKAGEGPRLAFVQAADAEIIAENLVAFANTEGGVIVIGLRSDGTPAPGRTESADIDKVLTLADELYNPPVVVEKWEEISINARASASNRGRKQQQRRPARP